MATIALPSLLAVDDGWSELAEEHGSIFATPERLLTWWRHFGGGRELPSPQALESDADTNAMTLLF